LLNQVLRQFYGNKKPFLENSTVSWTNCFDFCKSQDERNLKLVEGNANFVEDKKWKS